MRRNYNLLIDFPLANGQTGSLMIDSGDQNGVSLPPGQWKAWRAAHLRVAVGTVDYSGEYLGSGTLEDAWADEVTLGGLTLTHVHVGEAPADEVANTINYAGTLGLDALERMDLVVDGPGGHAYLKPLPSSEPADFARTRNIAHYAMGNWAVDGNVRLNEGPILAEFHDLRGLAKQKQGDADGAMADFTSALQFDPDDSIDAYSDRGDARKDKDDFSGAIADYSMGGVWLS